MNQRRGSGIDALRLTKAGILLHQYGQIRQEMNVCVCALFVIVNGFRGFCDLTRQAMSDNSGYQSRLCVCFAPQLPTSVRGTNAELFVGDSHACVVPDTGDYRTCGLGMRGFDGMHATVFVGYRYGTFDGCSAVPGLSISYPSSGRGFFFNYAVTYLSCSHFFSVCRMRQSRSTFGSVKMPYLQIFGRTVLTLRAVRGYKVVVIYTRCCGSFLLELPQIRQLAWSNWRVYN